MGFLGWKGSLLPSCQSGRSPLTTLPSKGSSGDKAHQVLRFHWILRTGHPRMFYHARSSFRSTNATKICTAPHYHSSCFLLSRPQSTLGLPWERPRHPRLWTWYLRPSLAISDTGRERTDVSPWPWHRWLQFMTLTRPEACSTVLDWAVLAQEALCVTALRAGPGKALPRADNQCLVWIKRKNKALRIIEADEEKTRDSNMRAKADYCFEPLMW